MSEFFYLIPISIALGLSGLGLFLWSLNNGQYDDLDGASERILYDDDNPCEAPLEEREVRTSGHRLFDDTQSYGQAPRGCQTQKEDCTAISYGPHGV